MWCTSVRCLSPALVAAALLSCHAGTGNPGAPAPDSGGTVVLGEDLTSGSVLLEALARRVPGLRVSQVAGACPIVMVRGQVLGRTSGSATVYVDGTRMGDTCILQQISPADVERVELYAVASGRSEGYVAGPGGLILVYRHR